MSLLKTVHVAVTTVARLHVKMVFTAIAFNLYQLRTLKKQQVYLAEAVDLKKEGKLRRHTPQQSCGPFIKN